MEVETHGNVYMFQKQLRRCEENAHNSVIQEKLDKLDAFYEEILELQVQLEEEHSIEERADEVERWRVLDVRVNAAGTVIQEKIRFQITADAEGIGKLCPSLAEIWLNSLGSGNSSQPVWISGHTSTQQSRSIEQEVQRSVAKAGEMERLSETVPIRMREFERQWCVQRSSALFAWFSHQCSSETPMTRLVDVVIRSKADLGHNHKGRFHGPDGNNVDACCLFERAIESITISRIRGVKSVSMLSPPAELRLNPLDGLATKADVETATGQWILKTKVDVLISMDEYYQFFKNQVRKLEQRTNPPSSRLSAKCSVDWKSCEILGQPFVHSTWVTLKAWSCLFTHEHPPSKTMLSDFGEQALRKYPSHWEERGSNRSRPFIKGMKAVRNAEWGLMGLRSSISYLLSTPYISNRTCRRITMRVVSCGKEESEKTETYRLSQVCFRLTLCG
ncbi:hypothetical protein T11_7952 [Trichinella zimbabwensis]|uniref:Uncharacterized protein n=1 Tax=Trichinella zimbabwensis TaxID=268475 RepID=A0A0V1HNP1_9BILA|nr:hypothetical protein T11_7952 [Trichinella zimbabwensis]